MTYAGFWKRAAAFLIDMVIANVGGIVVGIIPFIVLAASGNYDEKQLDSMARGVGLLIMWLYFALMESSHWQATVGKLVLGIRVTDLEGKRISFARATGRYFAKFVSSILLCLGFVIAGFTQKKQALHDIMADCLVVNKETTA